MIVNWVKAIASRGFPLKAADLALSVKQVVKDLNIGHSFKDGIPGRTWMRFFLNTHPDISIRQPEKLSKVRANVTQEYMRSWFKEVQEYCEKEMIQ